MLTPTTILVAVILAVAGGETIRLTEPECQARNGECVGGRKCPSVTESTPRCDKRGFVCCGASENRIVLQDTVQTKLMPVEHMTEARCQARNGECVGVRKCPNVTESTPRCDKRGYVCCGDLSPDNRITVEDVMAFDVLDDEDLTRVSKCSDRKCKRWYRGYWSGAGGCGGKRRVVSYCAQTNKYCCAPACQEKPKCIQKGGFCVAKKSDCQGTTKANWCKGKMCYCCIVDRADPLKYVGSHDIDICGEEDTYELIGGAIVNVHSPRYPSSYPPGQSCSLTLTQYSPSSLLFDVDIVEASLEKCSYDTLTISGNTYCGQTSPTSLTVADSNVTFNFVSDGRQSNYGFYATVQANCASSRRMAPDPQYRTNNYFHMCTDTYINATVATSGLINSYNYPCHYPELTCYTEIEAPVGYVLNITYIDFELEYNCNFDYLRVFDVGYSEGGNACLEVPPPFTRSTTNNVGLRYKTDTAYNNYRGFLIFFEAVLA